MDDESKKRLKQLCDQIAKEQDHERFSRLVTELNDLLDQTCTPNAHAESGSEHLT